MTIHDVSEMWDQTSRETSVSGGEYRTIRRVAYQVLHSSDETDARIERAPRVNLGDPYDRLFFVRAIRRTGQRVSPILSHVVIDYEGIVSENQRTPFDSRPKIEFGDITSTEQIDEDADGDPIMTKAGERYENVTEEFTDRLIVIQRNFRRFSPHVIDPYLRSVNSDLFLGYQPGQSRLLSLNATNQYIGDSDAAYYAVTARIHCRTITRASSPETTWYKRIRHEGYYCLIPDPFNGGALIKALARVKGRPVTRPVLLDHDGQMLPDDTTTAGWQEFKVRQPLPYRALGLTR